MNQKQKQQHPPGDPCEARINCPPSECKKGEFINPITHKCMPKGKCVDICPPKPVHHSKAYNQGYQWDAEMDQTRRTLLELAD